MSAFIENIIDDFVDSGYGEKIEDDSIRSFADDTVVVLEAIYEDEDVVGVVVYSNDLEVETLQYDDEDFAARLAMTLASELNI